MSKAQLIAATVRAHMAPHDPDLEMPLRVRGNVVGLPAWYDGMMYWPAIALVALPSGQVSARRMVFDASNGHRETRVFDNVDAAVDWALAVD